MFVKDEKNGQDDCHDSGHETERGPRSERRIQIGDANWAQDTSQTSASLEYSHPSSL